MRKCILPVLSAVFCAFLYGVSPAEARKNVILIIPDGTTPGLWSAVRAMTVGTDNLLNVDRLPVQGRCRTYSANAMITDSAAGATTYACGVKTSNGVLGMDASTVPGDSLTGKSVPSVLELAQRSGYATGLVTTAYIQHATPAAFYSHRAHRDWYDLIANDLANSNIDVIMGGGRQYMIPANTLDEEGEQSRRKDGRNIIAEMQRHGYTYVFDTQGFKELEPEKTSRLLGIFDAGHMEYEANRANDTAGEPPIWEMTETALNILSRKKKGFFLMVEAARIDHAAHDHMTREYLWDGIACDKAVGVAMEFAKRNKDTLVIVVPDHGCGGPHLVGLHDLATPDSAVINEHGFAHYSLNGLGFPEDDGGRPLAIQWVQSTGHTGEDVTVSAMGPHARELDGVIQNTDVFTIMVRHLGLKKKSSAKRDAADLIDF